MAYMSQEKKSNLTPAIKAVLKKYNMKGSISVNNRSTLVVTLKSGSIDFGQTYAQVNTYWIHDNYTGIAKDFLEELKEVMNDGNHDRSDSQSDYFDVGWYISINIGSYDKPYLFFME